MEFINIISGTNLDKNSQLIVLLTLVIILVILYLVFSFIDTEDNPLLGVVKVFLWVIVLIIIFLNALSYFFDLYIDDIFSLFLNEKPEIDNDVSLNMTSDEVFHIPGARFTYHDAKAVCNSMDSKLATREQVENAYRSGASWCSYGWANDQLALYPTSQTVFNELKTKKGHEYDCGLPGVNGGYISNPYIKFGANCYGVKPKKSQLEEEYFDKDNNLLPKTKKEVLMEQRIEYWKKRIGNILISPFNSESWTKV